jgi:hypothetical protein
LIAVKRPFQVTARRTAIQAAAKATPPISTSFQASRRTRRRKGVRRRSPRPAQDTPCDPHRLDPDDAPRSAEKVRSQSRGSDHFPVTQLYNRDGPDYQKTNNTRRGGVKGLMSDPQEAAFLAHIPQFNSQQLGAFFEEHGAIVSLVVRKDENNDLIVAFSDAKGQKLGPFVLPSYLAKMLRERVGQLGF